MSVRDFCEPIQWIISFSAVISADGDYSVGAQLVSAVAGKKKKKKKSQRGLGDRATRMLPCRRERRPSHPPRFDCNLRAGTGSAMSEEGSCVASSLTRQRRVPALPLTLFSLPHYRGAFYYRISQTKIEFPIIAVGLMSSSQAYLRSRARDS